MTDNIDLTEAELAELLKPRVAWNKKVERDGFKTCCKCKIEQTIDQYTKNRATDDGLDKRCKSCKKQIRDAVPIEEKRAWKERHLADPVKLERYKERRAIGTAKYMKSEKRKTWLEHNRDKVNAIKSKYKKSHPYQVAKDNALRRARLEEATIEEVDFDAIVERDEFICHICGFEIEPDDVHFDHVIPISKGGMHTMDNIHMSHARCNLKKHAKVTATIKAG